MIRVLFSDLKRAVGNWGLMVGICGTWIAGLCGVFAMIVSVKGGMGLGENVVCFTIAQTALSSELFLLIIPITSSISYTAVFMEEFRSRFILSYLPRAGRWRYLISKSLVTALSGGITVVCGMLLIFITCLIIFPPDKFQQELFLNYFSVYNRFFWEGMALCFLNGCLWALAGGMMAAITKNKYMSYAAPFILYYILTAFQKRYYGTLHYLNPQEWASPKYISISQAALILSCICTILCLIYCYFMRRRLENV